MFRHAYAGRSLLRLSHHRSRLADDRSADAAACIRHLQPHHAASAQHASSRRGGVVIALREAVPADAAAIAALHLRSWQTAYRGILPNHYIVGALRDDLAAQWQIAFLDRRQGLVLLAEA